MAKRKKRIPGLSFSWKKAFGITKTKRKIAKFTGIPTTKAGRQRKIGKIVTGGGCVMPVIISIFIIVSLIFIVI